MSTDNTKTFYRELMGLAIPLSLQNLLNALVGASDALMLGRLNQESVAAVSLANQISFVMMLFIGAVSGAAGILIAQYWGKRDYKRAKDFLSLAIRYSVAVSGVFFLFAFLFPDKLMSLFTTEAELVGIGADYLRIVSFSYIFAGVTQCYLRIIEISGHAKVSVYISAIKVVVDMTVDLFLIYGIGPFPALGANGAAYSTICVEAAALIWCLIWAHGKEDLKSDRHGILHFSKADERAVWKIIPGMLASGLSWGLSITIHSFIIGHLGTDATAAYSVTSVAQQLTQGLTHGISTGAGIMIGKLLGKNLLDKAREYGRRFWGVSFLCGLINIALMGAVGAFVYIFYALEPLAKTYLVQMLVFNIFYMFAYAFNTIIVVGVFPAGGDSKYDAISVILATWCFAVPLALLGCFVFNWPVIAVYSVMCLDEIVKVPFIPRRYKKYLWVKNLTLDKA